jgi:hypothetical protein
MHKVTQQKDGWKWQAEEVIHWSNNQTKAIQCMEHVCFAARRSVTLQLQNCHCSYNSVVLSVMDEVRVFRSAVDLQNCNKQLSTIYKTNTSDRTHVTGRMHKRISRKHSCELQNTWQSVKLTLRQAMKEQRENKGRVLLFLYSGERGRVPIVWRLSEPQGWSEQAWYENQLLT